MKSPPDKPQKQLPKKTPKANVGRNSSVYFVLGLVLMLLISYQSINYKSYDKLDIDIGALDLEKENEEEIPIVDLVKPPPPPPPPPSVAPEVFEVVEDEEEVEETVIESSETDQEDEIVEVEAIEVEEVEEEGEVPCSVIEYVPEYPGCEKGTNSEKRKCMSKKNRKIYSKKVQYRISERFRINRKTTDKCYF